MRCAAVPREINDIIMKALSKAKDERYATAAEMRLALETALRKPAQAKSRAKGIAAFAGIAAISAFGMFTFRERIQTTAERVMHEPVAEPVAMTTTMAAPITPSELPPAPAVEPASPAVAVAEPAPVAEKEPARVAVTPEPARVAVTPAPARVAVKEDVSDIPVPEEKKPSSALQRASAHQKDAEVRSKLTEARGRAKDSPSDAKVLRAWAMAALSAGETREARRAAEAWSAHDNSAEPRLVLAAAYEAANRHREARAVLEEWLANHPDTPEARKMLQRIGGGEPAVKRSRHPGSTTRPSGNATLEADQ